VTGNAPAVPTSPSASRVRSLAGAATHRDQLAARRAAQEDDKLRDMTITDSDAAEYQTAPPVLTKADYAYQQMRARILDGRLIPGSLLTAEAIGSELGLSTTPIREALRRLAADELVTLSAHREVRVNPLSRKEVEDLYRILLLLDPLAGELACENASDDELRTPRRLLASRRRGDAAREAMIGNRAFHRAIYGRCGSRVLVSLLESLWDRTDRYRLILLEPRETARRAHGEHAEMAEAFERRDNAALRRLTETHLENSLSALLKQFDRHNRELA
jgi:DNA-binding GntR family transcriptional regulator